jgi:hypothetical protein
MVRFIFLCMTVVALSLVTMGAQFLMDDMKDENASIMARNTPKAQGATVLESASTQEDAFSPEALNQIETTAGGFDAAADAGFGTGGFTNTAPKALGDDASTVMETKAITPAAN